jgi:hypothetical protein
MAVVIVLEIRIRRERNENKKKMATDRTNIKINYKAAPTAPLISDHSSWNYY